MLLIGYAASDNGSVIIRKGNTDDVFGIAMPREISFRNKYKPCLLYTSDAADDQINV